MVVWKAFRQAVLKADWLVAWKAFHKADMMVSLMDLYWGYLTDMMRVIIWAEWMDSMMASMVSTMAVKLADAMADEKGPLSDVY